MHLPERSSVVSWAVLEALPAGCWRSSFPSIQHLSGCTWSAVPSSGLPSAREKSTYWKESNKGSQLKGLEHLPEEQLRELRQFSLDKERLREILSACLNT